MAPPTLILASRSPRRAQLLRDAGYAFVQADPPFHDPPQPEITGDAGALTRELAAKKALSLRDAGVFVQQPGGVVLAADTACVTADGHLLGQPAGRADAGATLRAFLGREHSVVTGVALLSEGQAQPLSFSDAATVVMEPIGERELEAYLDSGEWRGKAGAYNLFDRQAAGWPIRVAGDPATVVGLPMRRLVPLLAQRGVTASEKVR